MGIGVDLFYDFLGVYVVVLIVMGYVRAFFLSLYEFCEGYKLNDKFIFVGFGMNWFMKYLVFLMVLYLLVYFSVDVFLFIYILGIFLCIFFIFVFLMVVVLIFVFIFMFKC